MHVAAITYTTCQRSTMSRSERRPARRRRRKQGSAAPSSPSSSSVELVDAPRTRAEENNDDDEEMDLEDVDVADVDTGGDSDGGEEMEEVDVADHHDQYASVHADVHADDADTASSLPVFYDGKGQMRGVADPNATGPTPLSITLTKDAQNDGATTSRKPRTNFVTPRDRAIRSDSHKIHVLALLAHAKVRNKWLNDEGLRDNLYNVTPVGLRQKLRAIHPKREPSQRERVRLFESFMGELVRWWAVKFYLDPDMSAAGAIRQPSADLVAGKFPRRGRRVDGWVVESEKDRQRRQAKEDASRRNGTSSSKGKGKSTATQPRKTYRPLRLSRNPRDSIALFPPGPPSEATATPTLLHLIQPPAEPIRSPADLIASAETRTGSRETSAQLFCALCRSLGIPARLVISPQVAPWSISAAKVAASSGNAGGRKKKTNDLQSRFARRGSDEATSEDYDYEQGGGGGNSDGDNGGFVVSGSKKTPTKTKKTVPPPRTGTASRPASVASTASAGEEDRPGSRRRQAIDVDATDGEVAGKKSTRGRAAKGKGKGKGKADGDAADDDGDYRDAKWKGITTPLEVEYKPKLRMVAPAKPKEGELGPRDVDDVDPIDLTAPPTMWVEVYSKPFQKWLTVDPIRARVSPTGNRQMEPVPHDRTNKLVYVVAFEEDGYARDVTARYTKTLHSRVSKLRPPAGGSRGRKAANADGDQATPNDWWAKVVAAFHRPERLERDAVEDAELEEAASKEPMPNSVGGFKDHPVFTLERFLKRDEAFQPHIQVGTFQGIPVFHRKNVVALRSARQWYNEGRVVKPDAGEPLKWVKSRGYTLANKRAAEQARQEGNEESLNEGLYSYAQTSLYTPPAVTYDPSTQRYTIPKNHFGNIDLYVPSMLPRGAAHIPQNGTAKIAKKLNIDYAEAVVGFEFRKHRSMPTVKGIVVPEEYEAVVLDAYWESEHLAAERELNRQQERAVKLWRKFVSALSIARRVQEQYGPRGEREKVEKGGQGQNEPVEGEVEEHADGADIVEPGGFLLDDDGEEGVVDDDDRPSHPPSPSPPPQQSKMSAKLEKYGSNVGRAAQAIERRGGDGDSESDGEVDRESTNKRRRIVLRHNEPPPSATTSTKRTRRKQPSSTAPPPPTRRSTRATRAQTRNLREPSLDEEEGEEED